MKLVKGTDKYANCCKRTGRAITSGETLYWIVRKGKENHFTQVLCSQEAERLVAQGKARLV